jgi:hypothetical protein
MHKHFSTIYERSKCSPVNEIRPHEDVSGPHICASVQDGVKVDASQCLSTPLIH